VSQTKIEIYSCDLCGLKVDLEQKQGYNFVIEYSKVNNPHPYNWVGIVCNTCSHLNYDTVIQRMLNQKKEKTKESSYQKIQIFNFFPVRKTLD
jgi:hypothetical protein